MFPSAYTALDRTKEITRACPRRISRPNPPKSKRRNRPNPQAAETKSKRNETDKPFLIHRRNPHQFEGRLPGSAVPRPARQASRARRQTIGTRRHPPQRQCRHPRHRQVEKQKRPLDRDGAPVSSRRQAVSVGTTRRQTRRRRRTARRRQARTRRRNRLSRQKVEAPRSSTTEAPAFSANP